MSLCILTALVAAAFVGGFSFFGRQSEAQVVRRDPVLVGAGDIASCLPADKGDSATAKLLGKIRGRIFVLGDNAYGQGSRKQYANCYGPTWGRQKARTYPAVGNHEYMTPGASGYFGYFGSRAGSPKKGYYSYDLGKWHVVVLNSNCEYVGCGPLSPQVSWLKKDLAGHPSRCTLAYWHHPLFSSGAEHGNDPRSKTFWKVLYKNRADVILSGHDHDYERFARQTPGGKFSRRGIREFVVGTGGKELRPFGVVQPNSMARSRSTNGVLKLTLHPTSYSWRFIPTPGGTFTDSGNMSCR